MAEIAIAGATAVLRQAITVLGNLVVKEGSRLLRLTEDFEWIENEMRYIQAYLEDVEKQWGSRGVTNLVRNIWDIAYDVEDIVNTYFPKPSSRGRNNGRGRLGWWKSAKFMLINHKTARDFAVEIEGIKRRVEDIDRVRRTYGIQERRRVLFLDFKFLEISLPSEIGNLSHLSYIRLKVRRGRVKLPFAIGNLRSLQTLDARDCNDLIIPDCILKMKQLRDLKSNSIRLAAAQHG